MSGTREGGARIPAAPVSTVAAIGGVLVWSVAVPAQAQDTAELGEISVTAGRGPEGVELSSVPGSVTVIGREEIERQRSVSNQIDDLLAQKVPGFSPGNHARSNFGASLRGRDFLVMIDGVPVSTPLRDGARDLQSIDLSAVERVEVVRGSVATYGAGATGGIVNIITRGSGGPDRRWTEFGGSFSTTHPDGSGGMRVEQGFAGTRGDTRYSVSASVEESAGYFDADGDRIPPNPFGSQGGSDADSTIYNLQARLDHSLDDQRSLGVSANVYDSEQDSDFTAEFDPAAEDKAEAVRRGPDGPNEIEVGTENTTLALTYRDRQLWGQDFQGKLFHQESEAVFAWFDYGAVNEDCQADPECDLSQEQPYFPFDAGSGNSILKSEKVGARGEFDARIGATAVTWGVDLSRDETSQRVTNGRMLTPEIVQDTFAPFVQLERDLGERWTVRGGVRHERARVDVDDFTALQTESEVEGGTLDYSETVFNLGAVYRIDETYSAFASFSQGFSLAEIGNVLRSTGEASVDAIDPEAQVVDNYELGVRATGLTWDASIALFENRSDEGTTYTGSVAAGFEPQQQKERVYGLEADLNVDIGDAWRTGGTLTIAEGKYDADEDGDVDEYLDGTRISPPKLTTYLEYSASEWTHRADLLYVGSRDRFDDDVAGFGQGEVDSYATVDWTSSTRLGEGTLRLSVSNLLNEQYVPALGQAYNSSGAGYTAAPGQRVAASYAWQW